MANKIMPKSRPQMGADKALLIKAAKNLKDGFFIIGIEGYYANTMGVPGKNDRMMYDDALFLVRVHAGQVVFFKSYNANVDPGGYRKGRGTGASKGMAKLKKGTWWYQLGLHKGQYMALRQAEKVIVVRDGTPDYEDFGWFGINIHKGGYAKVSSIGCQTIWPDQWDEFIRDVKALMKDSGQSKCQYCLLAFDDPAMTNVAPSIKALVG